VTAALQCSLLDQSVEPDVAPLAHHVHRTTLSHGAWVDIRRGWVTGADTLFERLVARVAWQAERRRMYDRTVEVPRLLSFYGERDPLPDPVLLVARHALDKHYAAELREPFVTAGLCYYRDGRDSVAWHGDTIGRGGTEDTMVAILSVGQPRALQLRPRRPAPGEGAPSLRLDLGHGDLLVMGGSCQRTWEHAVPKTARPVGPRISIQFRPAGVR
jgi:alkylated DNA repair dioxygenase AlkB